MSYDVGEAAEGLSSVHSPSFQSLHLCHNSFSNPSVASPTSQLILQPFFRYFYVTGFSLTSPGEPPMIVNIVGVGSRDELRVQNAI